MLPNVADIFKSHLLFLYQANMALKIKTVAQTNAKDIEDILKCIER